MSTRVLIEMICDECSYVETFVYLETNQNGAVACVRVQDGSAKKRGWTTGRYEDSKLIAKHFCPSCTTNKGK